MTTSSTSSVATLAQLQATFDSATSIYVLVDPMQGEPIPLFVDAADGLTAVRAAREAAWGRQVTAVPLDPRVPLTETQQPYVVTLQGADDEWLADTLEIAQAERHASQADGLASDGAGVHRISWLQTSLFGEDVAAAVAQMLRVNTSAWTDARYMRLADRRVLSWLRYVVGDARVAAQFGRLRRWVYLDACGRLAQLTHADDGVEQLTLKAEEWKFFMRGERMHATAARWLGELALSGDQALCENSQQDREIYAQVAAALGRAERAAQRWPTRFVRARDQDAWAVLSLLHADIEHDTRVRAVLQARPEEEGEPDETMHTLSITLRALMLKGIHS
ncbi:hypothetical protein J2W32_005050 [Variovorax boronicumulans]|uniref:DUF4123 domain-containing protein n=1 Tax=Variovorax boronicumulans TaxID=436515 RepID=A0AAW8D3W7_9BURK|nr:hypothetical protein [Variovorax boronicumulans]MDP9895950.1 hypothetical protein [Variovorax boronicumulans]MDQ0055990.1 hypothetical protein [Variovorax boronicumulans]